MTRTATPRATWLAELPATFTWAQARELGLTNYALYQLRDEQLIDRLGRGLYARSDRPLGDDDLLTAALRAPRATICLRSALARHGLIDDIPARLDLALPDGARAPALELPITWHRFSRETFAVGRERLELPGGASTGLYGPERSIIDAFRLRRLEGPELGNEALKRWLTCRGSQPSTLLRLAEQFPRAAGPLRRTLEVLL
jgi:hypothetical protein